MGLRAVVAALLVLAACDAGGAAASSPGRELVDARGRKVRVPPKPRRIVSLLPSVTELLFAVGAGPQVVAVSRYCSYPPEVKALPTLGDLAVDPEALVALKADLVVGGVSQNRVAIEGLEQRGFSIFAVEAQGFEAMQTMLRLLGDATGHAEEGARRAEEVRRRVEELTATRAAPPSVYFEHSVDPVGTAGTETFIGDLIRRAGGANVIEGGWRLIDWELVLAKDPDVILVAHGRRADLERRAGWAGLKAVKAGRIHTVPKEHFVYATPRLVEGLAEVRRILDGAGK